MRQYWLISVALLTLTLPFCLFAQESESSLGDIARQLRREKEEKEKKEHNVIDNENLDQRLNELQSKRFNSTTLLFSLNRSEEHTSELQSHSDLVCRLL